MSAILCSYFSNPANNKRISVRYILNNSHHLSCCISLHLANFIKLVTINCFLYVLEHKEVTQSKAREL